MDAIPNFFKDRIEGREATQRMAGHHSIVTTDGYVRAKKGDKIAPLRKKF